jgi:hypothetical protein
MFDLADFSGFGMAPEQTCADKMRGSGDVGLVGGYQMPSADGGSCTASLRMGVVRRAECRDKDAGTMLGVYSGIEYRDDIAGPIA